MWGTIPAGPPSAHHEADMPPTGKAHEAHGDAPKESEFLKKVKEIAEAIKILCAAGMVGSDAGTLASEIYNDCK